MIYASLTIFCIVFVELFLFLNIRKDIALVASTAQESLRVLASAKMTDDAKEAFVRRASLALFKATGFFAAKVIAILFTLYFIYFLFIVASPGLEQDLLRSFVSPMVILITSIVAMCYAWVRNVILK